MFSLFKKQPQPAVDVPTLDRGMLVPRIRHETFVEALKAQGVPPEQMPVTLPLCGELLVTFAFDLPDQFVMATPPLLAQAGIAIGELAALSQANLKGRFSAQILRTGHDGLMRVEAGDAFEAVMLIFDGFWDGHVRSLLTGDIVAAAPRRDVLLIADAAVPGAVDALREQAVARLEGSTDPHGLSAQAMLRQGRAWQLLPRESA